MVDDRICRSTLGGAGLAISISTEHRKIAAQYAEFVASPQCQMGLYFHSGGQPGYRKAWLDPEINQQSLNFFLNTLPTLDAAYVRPRFNGYLTFQENAGPIIHKHLMHGGKESYVLDELNRLLRSVRNGLPMEGEA